MQESVCLELGVEQMNSLVPERAFWVVLQSYHGIGFVR